MPHGSNTHSSTAPDDNPESAALDELLTNGMHGRLAAHSDGMISTVAGQAKLFVPPRWQAFMIGLSAPNCVGKLPHSSFSSRRTR